MKRLARVDLTWTAKLAYVIGVITTDGNLSPDGRHINITSKDYEMVVSIRKLLKLKNKIGKKARGGSQAKIYSVLQFGDINFYEFLLSIGLMPAKSKTLKALSIPRTYFVDFLRGCIDGDGSIGAFKHPESRFPQIRVRLVSASPSFLMWMLHSVQTVLRIKGGYVYKNKNSSVSTLSFGKEDSRKIISLMYYEKSVPALARKRKRARALLRGE